MRCHTISLSELGAQVTGDIGVETGLTGAVERLSANPRHAAYCVASAHPSRVRPKYSYSFFSSPVMVNLDREKATVDYQDGTRDDRAAVGQQSDAHRHF